MSTPSEATPSKPSPKVDGYLRKSPEWQAELQKLRAIILDAGLTEDVKWRTPCYTVDGGNVLFIGRFKDYCILSFLKGVLLKDAKKLLVQQTENMQGARVIKFTSLQEIEKLEPVLRAYVREAAEVERAGLKVPFKKITEHAVPEELAAKLAELPKLKAAFEALTPGRQRAYYLYVAGAKQAKTRAARVDKYIAHILNGKGIDDE